MNTPSPIPLSDADVHAFVDGQLPPDRAEVAAAAVAANPERAARVADMRSRNALLREALEAVLSEPIPDRLLDAMQGTPRATATFRFRWLKPAFALAATLALGV